MRLLYSALYYCLLPLLLLRMLWRSRLAPGYRRRLPERFVCSRATDAGTPAIWVHRGIGRETSRPRRWWTPAARLPRLPGGADHHYAHRLGAGGALFGDRVFP